jgi:hypothetical protein
MPGKFNIEVYYTVPEMYLIKLFTCIECGEVFVVDFENPNLSGKTVEQIVADTVCPQCGRLLPKTIRPYPKSFRADDGRIGRFEPEPIIPPDSESLVKEFLEIGMND